MFSIWLNSVGWARCVWMWCATSTTCTTCTTWEVRWLLYRLGSGCHWECLYHCVIGCAIMPSCQRGASMPEGCFWRLLSCSKVIQGVPAGTRRPRGEIGMPVCQVAQNFVEQWQIVCLIPMWWSWMLLVKFQTVFIVY